MKKQTKFIPALRLAELYYKQAVFPILDRCFPKMKHAAALIGHGSEVLEFDDSQSMDHDWGPRVLLFFSDKDYSKIKGRLVSVLHKEIPKQFLGYPTRVSMEGKKELRIEVHSMKSYFANTTYEKNLTFDPNKDFDVLDWLTFPQQELLVLTAGKVFRDDLGELTRIRKKLAYYPHDVWLYLLASQWRKLGQEEAFVGRAAQVGDELGSQILASRQVREIMRLCFLMEKEYAPYTKWFGSGFSRLQSAKRLAPILRKVILAQTFKERERQLSKAYEYIAKKHNSLKLTRSMPTKASLYFDRPFKVIHADKFADAITKKIKNKKVKNLKAKIGSIDQFADNTDLICNTTSYRKLRGLYR